MAPEIFCSIQVSWWHCPEKDFVQYVCVFVGCLSGLSVPDFDFSVCFFEYDKKESSCKEFVKFGILPFVVFIDFLIVDVFERHALFRHPVAGYSYGFQYDS